MFYNIITMLYYVIIAIVPYICILHNLEANDIHYGTNFICIIKNEQLRVSVYHALPFLKAQF